MKITPITFEEAKELLGVAGESTIRNATMWGNLTRIPGIGARQHVALEQVEIFKGMKRISVKSLSAERRQQWEEIKRAIEAPAPVPDTNELPQLSNKTLEALNLLNSQQDFEKAVRGAQVLVAFGKVFDAMGLKLDIQSESEVQEDTPFSPSLV